MTSSTEPKTIILRTSGHNVQEAPAAAASAIKPGYLLERTSTGAVRVEQTVTTERPANLFAIEAGYAGKTIDDTFAVGDAVPFINAGPGDQVYAFLDDNISVAIGAYLQSAGNGALKADSTGAAIAVALEAVSTVGGAVAFGRIRVEII